eukprot:symbB.v1.2.017314.t1/scaffold1341.1/size124323/5
MAVKPWNHVKQHAVHRLKAEWWDPCFGEKLNGTAPDELPHYTGWPTAGPSSDPMLLKTRSSVVDGHVDWVGWTRETSRSSSRSTQKRRVFSRRVPPNRWCQNYGYIGTDGQVHWPEEGGALVGAAWRSSGAPLESRILRPPVTTYEVQGPSAIFTPQIPPEPHAEPKQLDASTVGDQQKRERLAERLLEGERVWALLRSAYLAGAANGDNCPCSGARDVADGEKEAEQGKKEGGFDTALLEASVMVREKLQALRSKTEHAGQVLQKPCFCISSHIVTPASVAVAASL